MMVCSALAGLLLSLTPLSNALLGWRGAGGLGAAQMYVNSVLVSVEKLIRNFLRLRTESCFMMLTNTSSSAVAPFFTSVVS